MAYYMIKCPIMTKAKNTLTALWSITTLALFFAGCSTTINVQVQRPPTLNTLGIQRLAVMPFTTTDRSPLQRQAAAWLTNESLTRIQGTNHFTLISASEIDHARANNGNVEALADALFSGQVISVTVQNSSQQGSYKDKEGNEIAYTTYTREVRLSYNYNITRTRDGTMVGPVNKSVSTSSSARDNQAALNSAETMVQNLIKSNMSGLARDIAPYTATEQRKIIKEFPIPKDKVLKQRLKDADALVKAKNYRAAQYAFYAIYEDTGNFTAGYNAAILIEVQGDREQAAALLQRVYNDTGNPKAAAEISRLYQAMADAGLLEAYKTNQNQRDKVIALMVETLPSRMPPEPRIAVINNSRNEKDLADAVVNGIIDGLISQNIIVVDRNNQSLVEMERNYQYSGNVSDEEMVSLGHEVGVNTFVLVSITGAGGSRRLSVQMLDIERSTIIYQSPQTNDMNL